MTINERPRLFFCAHCEWEMEAIPYLDHMRACIAFHVEHWPIHAVAWEALGASGCPELCGKPHGEDLYEHLARLDGRNRTAPLDTGRSEV